MIEISNLSISGFEDAFRGMRNPLNSWDKSDSEFEYPADIGENDLKLAKRLIESGNDHGKFMRFIDVCMDIKAPLYWWKEFDTYKVGTVANSCSTMHTIHKRPFVFDDFSIDEGVFYRTMDIMCKVVDTLNDLRDSFLETKDKTYWRAMIQILPESYMQLRTVKLNYAVLRNMYHSRKEHKLQEWRDFCEWIRGYLPYSDELIVN